MNRLLLIILLMIPVSVYGAVIDGPANIREEANGDTIFNLNNGVFVREIYKKDKWYRIEIDAYIKMEDFNKLPDESVKLFDKFDNEIGCTVNYKSGLWERIREKGGKAYIVLDAYTHQNNIIETTAHDYLINNILNNNISLTKRAFYEIFKDWKRYGNTSEYDLLEIHKAEDIEIVMIFNKGSFNWYQKSIFGFIDNKLKFIGVMTRDFDKKEFIKQKENNYYYLVGKNTFTESEINDYLEPLIYWFESGP